MTQAEKLADFITKAAYEDLSEAARRQAKIRILDSLGCAIGALPGAPIRLLKKQVEEFGGAGQCTLIGGGRTAPDRAAFHNSALVRYLDFSDTFLAKGESCHPSDNLGAVLAATEYARQSGRQLLLALAVAYQVQCTLCVVAPVRRRGFDHVTQLAFGVAAGVSKALGLDPDRAANAIAISGTAFNALRVTRTGALSHWKGLAAANTAFCATHATFLAMRGITGPREVFEGNKGFMETISGRFGIDWSRQNLEIVSNTAIKKYNAEMHSQSVLEGILELRAEGAFRPQEVEKVEIEIFDVAYNIIGGGEEGSKILVRTKEEADHSLPYMAAVAILDGQVMPEQYRPDRVQRNDVQSLLRKVTIRPADIYTHRFPKEMPCRILITLSDGRVVVKEKTDVEGWPTRPMSWAAVAGKFECLAAPLADSALRREIVEAVDHIDRIPVVELTRLLGKVQTPS